MDPVGAASIAGLISFAAQAAQVAAQLHNFLTTVAEDPQEIQDLSTDLLQLHGLLSNIANIGMKLERSTFVDDTTILNIEGCMVDLKRLDKIVQRAQSGAQDPGIAGKGRRAWGRMKWAFAESDIRKSMEKVCCYQVLTIGVHADIATLLATHGCDPSIPNISGQNALFAHSTHGRMAGLITAIIRQDHFIVDLEHVVYLGHTPLMWEVYEQSDDTSWPAELIKNGASVTRKGNNGLTALHHALLFPAPEYKRETVKLLLQAGARGNEGITPSDIARHMGVSEEWRETLSECGFNLEKIERENQGQGWGQSRLLRRK